MNDKKVSQYVALADHYKAIGQYEINLYRPDEADKPWEYVTEIRSGGTHRLNLPVDVRVTATHPCGLRFSWIEDMEVRDANGHSAYMFDTAKIARILAVLPDTPEPERLVSARDYFIDYLQKAAAAIRERADEYQREAEQMFGAAAVLDRAMRPREQAVPA